MNVTLKHSSDLYLVAFAGRTCTDSVSGMCMTNYDEVKGFIKGLIDKGHESVIEHMVYTFHIQDVSRAALQEIARHRIASLSVQSTRWTLKKLSGKEEDIHTWPEKYLKRTGNSAIDYANVIQLSVGAALAKELPNDVVKYVIPEAMLTQLVMTINARSLRNFFKLRSSSRALKEMQELARAMFNALPETHKFMFEDVMNG